MRAAGSAWAADPAPSATAMTRSLPENSAAPHQSWHPHPRARCAVPVTLAPDERPGGAESGGSHDGSIWVQPAAGSVTISPGREFATAARLSDNHWNKL